MAEFQEVMEQFDRMCLYYQHKRECPMACPMNGVNISQCRKVAFEEPKVTEKTVMAWATEHPVVYPTWEEWLSDKYNLAYNDDFRLAMSREHIPADIVQKLGIELKER